MPGEPPGWQSRFAPPSGRLGADLALAVVFLTRLPAPVDHARAAERLAGSAWAWPIVGAGVGLAAGGLLLGLAAMGVAPGPAAVAAIALQLALTGALHEDGLADLLDGLGAPVDRARAIEIMRDSRVGVFGASGLALGLLWRWSALVALAPIEAAAALVAAGALSRVAPAALMTALRPAVETGLSARAGAGNALAAGGGAAIALGVATLAFGSFVSAVVAAGAAAAGAALIGFWAWGRLGGRTGDVLGASAAAAELGALTAATALLARTL